MAKTIVIADDHPVVLQGLVSLIAVDPGLAVVGRAEDGIAALEAIRETRPDLAVLDLIMPRMSGRGVLDAIVKEGLPTRVVLLTASASDAELYDAIAAGAAGVVVKDSGIETLLTCLRTVSTGGRWLSDEVVGPALSREANRREAWRALTAALTAREREIVRLVLEGVTTKQISFKIRITHGTAKVHMNNIFRKMKISSRSELHRLASDPFMTGRWPPEDEVGDAARLPQLVRVSATRQSGPTAEATQWKSATG
jgi:DNA-binding NarL/FixJ family response regulator